MSIDTANHAPVLRVAWAAHKGAGHDTGENAEAFMKLLLPAGSFVMSDRDPDIILFMSGGSGEESHLADAARASGYVTQYKR